ncbi:MAG: DUF4446 family protein [Eubacteriales bacterium]|nr:DUF4446 family protein [Eubacteriales bacterium]
MVMDIMTIVAIASVVISLISLIVATIAIKKYNALYRKYDMFMRGRDAESLEDFIIEERYDIEELQDADASNKEAMRLMNRNIRSSFQKFGIVHYDAFDGMGGKMSFAMTMLDYTNSGIVLNCMHAREGCFLYVKEVDAGTTDTPLGAEEKESLERALGYIKD